MAVANIVSQRAAKVVLPREARRANAFRVQKWGKSRVSRKLALVDGSADGRVSHFGLPRPNLGLDRRGIVANAARQDTVEGMHVFFRGKV